jgi:hypothetical protein
MFAKIKTAKKFHSSVARRPIVGLLQSSKAGTHHPMSARRQRPTGFAAVEDDDRDLPGDGLQQPWAVF